VIYNFGQSSIDCVVRRISEHGATVSVESPLGIRRLFHLHISDESAPRSCKMLWQSEGDRRRIGDRRHNLHRSPAGPARTSRRPDDRGQMLAFRSALHEIQIGVVLLDADLRAQFINQAFRRMWKLPDQVADSKPAFAGCVNPGAIGSTAVVIAIS
jgi:PAS domain-containing protein